MLNTGWNIETYITISTFLISVIGSLLIIKLNWKKYGFLFLLSGVIGVVLCYIFIYLDLYTFPYRILPHISKIPFTAILTVFPLYVLLGVRYSPKSWAWKIPFYWVMVHLGMAGEVFAESKTQLIKYGLHWDVWDSYTWWWIYLLVFELIGSLIVTEDLRKALDKELLRYGQLGWFLLHFTLITTVFLGGVYAGKTLLR